MKNLSKLFFLLLSTAAAFPASANCGSICDNIYLIAGVGGSFSRCADICTDSNFWDPATEGYDSKLGRSEMYNIGLGYDFCPMFRGTVEASFRPSFKYCKFQTGIDNGQINFLGDKTRYFNLSNASLMFNGYAYGGGLSPYLDWNLGCNFCAQPYIGAGVGVSYNRMKNFHSVTTTAVQSLDETVFTIGSAMLPNTARSFSWQFIGGLEVARASLCSLDIGYRYFDGGKIRSNNWIFPGNAITATPWKGKLRAHEFFVNFNIFKDF